MTQMPSSSAPSAEKEGRSSPAELDRVLLAQALRDFEIANTRVLDLTQRLIESERRRRDMEHEVAQLRLSMHGSAPAQDRLAYRAARWAFHRAREVAQRVLKNGQGQS
ncbi:hypothetical protein POL68_07520 [Stigmatella sp. ncwal1]|uniref:Uncharacterized protein n=1 Tax=Stigmatella ashevillensis TaxID=2995309 RepID=A0ABT5D7R8_9BACT|nr:hypothetical protein [Stigmatella ashevillena]MDC0708317.1 hypothetical protein [Stigmatella ashevillena]